jgi:hypothetical protein
MAALTPKEKLFQEENITSSVPLTLALLNLLKGKV